MLIKTRKPHDLSECDVTPEPVYLGRRRILQVLGAAGLIASSSAQAGIFDWFSGDKPAESTSKREPLKYVPDSPKPSLTLTPESKATHHNNFYEFGTSKTDPAENSEDLQIEPWTVTIEGEVEKPGTIDVWPLIRAGGLEERIYRLRCVEAWSMVIPWVGFELGSFLQRFKPTSKAKYVAFQTLYDPQQMPGQASRFKGGESITPTSRGCGLTRQCTH